MFLQTLITLKISQILSLSHVFDTCLNNFVSNCNALFACSVIMMACAAVSASFGLDDASATGGGQKVPSNLISVFHFVRGVHSVIDKARNWLEDGPFRPVVLYDPSHSTEPTHLPADENEVLNKLRSLCPDENIYPILHHTYETAIDLLEECFKTNGGMVIPWLVLVGEEFVNQVYEEDPSALVIYTCWGAILSRLTEMWWARRAGKSSYGGRPNLGGRAGRQWEWDDRSQRRASSSGLWNAAAELGLSWVCTDIEMVRDSGGNSTSSTTTRYIRLMTSPPAHMRSGLRIASPASPPDRTRCSWPI